MDRVAVDSTMLAWVRYSPGRLLLEAGFHTGEVYEYFEVPERTFQELLHADSKGRYFNLHIRNHFRTQMARTLRAGEQN